MADTLIDKLTGWNRRMNGIPRKGLLIAITLFFAWLLVKAFPYCWPFIVATLFSMILEPFVRFVAKKFPNQRMSRNIATLFGMLVLFGLVALLATILINRLWHEIVSLARVAPGMISQATSTVIPWAQDLYRRYQDILPPSGLTMLDDAIRSVGQTVAGFATTVSRMVTAGAWTTAMSVMDVVLSVVLTIMGTFYLTADRSRITGFFVKNFPHDVIRHSNLIKTNLIRALFGQVKSQLTVSLVIIVFLVLVFVVFGIPYGLLVGLAIGVADALPVIGAGLFLIPWSVVGFVVGDVRTGLIMACTYVGMVAIRQIVEPRVVGKNLGLYPLATMMAMYAGYQSLGVLGLLGGPVMLNVIKVVLAADKETDDSAPSLPEEKPTGEKPPEDSMPPAQKPFKVKA